MAGLFFQVNSGSETVVEDSTLKEFSSDSYTLNYPGDWKYSYNEDSDSRVSMRIYAYDLETADKSITNKALAIQEGDCSKAYQEATSNYTSERGFEGNYATDSSKTITGCKFEYGYFDDYAYSPREYTNYLFADSNNFYD